MNELTLMDIAEDNEAKLDEYEELLVRCDHYRREAESNLIAYTAEFGDLIIANFELKIECIKKKKTISYCRRRMNRGLPIDTDKMQEEIEKEMKLYYEQLKEMIADYESAKHAEGYSDSEYNRVKKIYRRLAKLIHPDINKKTMENEDLKDLWNRVVRAYKRVDADELGDLEVLVNRVLDKLGDEGIEIDISDLDERIERLESQINNIISTEPYTYGEILSSKEKILEHKERLRDEYSDYEQYLENLTRVLDDMLREGGVKLVWKMN